MGLRADPGWRVGIVYAAYYPQEVSKMVRAAVATLKAAGVRSRNITLHGAPGSFEVPFLGSVLARMGSVDALIGLGIVVQGETHHADLVAREAARGIMDVQLTYGIPFAFEILAVADIAQARVRACARGPENKGAEAARATLASLDALRRIRSDALVGRRRAA